MALPTSRTAIMGAKFVVHGMLGARRWRWSGGTVRARRGRAVAAAWVCTVASAWQGLALGLMASAAMTWLLISVLALEAY